MQKKLTKRQIVLIIMGFTILILCEIGIISFINKEPNESENDDEEVEKPYKLEGWSEDKEIFCRPEQTDPLTEFDMAFDSNNNLHILWAARKKFTFETDPSDPFYEFQKIYTKELETVYYKKLNQYGDILVNNTRIANYWSQDIQFLNIAIDSKDNVHCSWGGLCFDKYKYTKLDNNGNILINDTDPSKHVILPILIDSKNYINTISGNNYDLFFSKLNNDGKFIIEQKRITFKGKTNRSTDCGIIIDSDDKLHLIFSRDSNLYYMKLDNNGNILINATQLTFKGTAKGKTLEIGIDSQDNIHIIWDDNRDNITIRGDYGQGEPFVCYQSYYRKLDKFGNTLVYDKRLSYFNKSVEEGGHKDFRFAIDSIGNIHITFDKWTLIERYEDWYIFYQILDNNGNNITNVTRISTERGWGPEIAIDFNDKVHIIWDSDDDFYYKTNNLKENNINEIDDIEGETYISVFDIGIIIIMIIIIFTGIIVWKRKKNRNKI